MTSIVEFIEFSFRYPHTEQDIIQNASFKIEKGTLTLLYGLSGSGKSTLCYAMTGLIPWSVRGFIKGDVKILGKNTKETKPNQFAGDIGYLMQNPDSQFATLNVRDELIFAAENIQIDKLEIEKRFQRIVELLDLRTYLDRNVTQLSSGEKQRVVLGSILMMEPALLILDEPLSFLDYPNRLKLLGFLRKVLSKYSDLSVIIAEHRINDIIPLATNFLEIKDGLITPVPFPEVKSQKFIPNSSIAFSYKDLIHHYGFQEDSSDYPEQQIPDISFKQVSFNYTQYYGKFTQNSVTILHKISFKAFPGEIIAIIGPNGIGKTTLLYLIAGILQTSDGEIFFKGQDIAKLHYGKYSRNIGLIFQNPESQLLKNTIKKEIEFGPKNFGIRIEEDQIQRYLEFIFSTSQANFKALFELHPFNLSWGEKRRLNLASLFAYSPSIYLFDEPYTGQDYIVRTKLLKIIKSISENSGLTIISSHDEEILQSCSRVFLLDESGFTNFKKNQKLGSEQP
ncbi:MAG: ABC transporter ATP-binding protein [Candidatus Lokiarchaeota archaeon]|nr:ABC transporter ATP-binding protein [Candidatus Lokiarchaeota archaeon]